MKSDYERTKYIIHNSVSSFDVAKEMGFPIDRYGRMKHCPICNHTGNQGFVANNNNSDRNGGYYCFYGHHGGDCIDLVMKYNGYSYNEAVNWIIHQFGLNVPEQTELTDSEQTALTKEQKTRNAFLVLYDAVIKLYFKVMTDNKTELISESNNLLENVVRMIKSIP